MSTTYTNLPSENNSNELGQTAFVNFFTVPIEVNAGTLDAMKSFFTARGFDETSALSFASMLIYQAKKDNTNPMKILDLLKGFNSIELNSLVAEVVNYNRFKTSYLGFGSIFSPNNAVSRNVLP